MFDPEVGERLRQVVQALVDEPIDLATNAEKAALLRAVQDAQDLLDGVKARALASFEQSGGPEEDGAPNVKAWARERLRLDARETGRLTTAARTLRTLPEVSDAFEAGRIRLSHVYEFSAGLKKGGDEVMMLGEDYLLDVAESHEPGALRAEISEWIDALYPDMLTQAYIDGLDKRDLAVSPVGDHGYAVKGFLDIPTGRKLKTVLDSLGAATDRDDRRTPAERRLAGLDALLESVLDAGLPTRKGIRPQLQLTVDLDRLRGVPGAEPARLAGWGIVADELVGYLLCDSEITGVLTDGFTGGDLPQAAVLNVGRAERLATPAQRTAVHLRQGGRCANPGCVNAVLELHHLDWWARDLGLTDLDTLIGLCARCHHLVHAGRLHARGNGDGTATFTLAAGTSVPDRRRAASRLARERLRVIRRTLAAYAGTAPDEDVGRAGTARAG